MYHYDFSVKIMKGERRTVRGEIRRTDLFEDFFSHREILWPFYLHCRSQLYILCLTSGEVFAWGLSSKIHK